MVLFHNISCFNEIIPKESHNRYYPLFEKIIIKKRKKKTWLLKLHNITIREAKSKMNSWLTTGELASLIHSKLRGSTIKSSRCQNQNTVSIELDNKNISNATIFVIPIWSNQWLNNAKPVSIPKSLRHVRRRGLVQDEISLLNWAS